MSLTYTKYYRFPKVDFLSEPWIQGMWDTFDAIDLIMYNNAMYVGVSQWSNSTEYNVGNTTIDTADGTSWLCLVAHTSAPAPTTFAQDRLNHPTYWGSAILTLNSPALTGNPTAPTPPPPDNSNAIATTAFVKTAIAATVVTPAQNRNRFINGNFLVDQYNSNATVTPPNGGYACDRWVLFSTASALSSACTLFNISGIGMGLSIKAVTSHVVAPSDTFAIAQAIEWSDVGDFCWGTGSAQSCTLSFWLNATVAGQYSGSICNKGATRSYVFPINVTVPNVLRYYTITIPGDTAGTWYNGVNDMGIQVRFDLGTGATYRTSVANTWISGNFVGLTGSVALAANNGAFFQISNVQLELGGAATPFDFKDAATTLAQCQRYYEIVSTGLCIWNGDVLLGYGYNVSVPFKTTKRVNPSVVLIDGGGSVGFPAGAPTLNSVDQYGLIVYKAANATGYGSYVFGAKVSAEFF